MNNDEEDLIALIVKVIEKEENEEKGIKMMKNLKYMKENFKKLSGFRETRIMFIGYTV